MKKLLLVLAVLVLPVGVSAAVIGGGGKEYVVDANIEINDDLYTAAHNIAIKGNINGDAILAGQNVTITSDVVGDVMVVGERVQIGNVSDDVRVAGANIHIGGVVGDDVMAAGERVYFARNSEIGGDVRVVGETVIFDGVIAGDVWVRAGKVTINGTIAGDVNVGSKSSLVMGDSAQIAGDFIYHAPMPTVAEGSVGGEIVYTERVHESAQSGGGEFFAQIAWLILKVVTWGIVVLVAMRLFGKYFVAVTKKVVDAPAMNMVWGLMAVIVVPVLIVFAMISIVGIGLGLVAMVLLAMMMFVTKITAFAVVGTILNKWLTKSKKYEFDWKVAFLGVAVVLVVAAIPVIGTIAKALLCLTILGAIVVGLGARWSK